MEKGAKALCLFEMVHAAPLQEPAPTETIGAAAPSPISVGIDKFARDLQERLGIPALLALSAPFRICTLISANIHSK
jgi:hypothetical protein